MLGQNVKFVYKIHNLEKSFKFVKREIKLLELIHREQYYYPL